VLENVALVEGSCLCWANCGRPLRTIISSCGAGIRAQGQAEQWQRALLLLREAEFDSDAAAAVPVSTIARTTGVDCGAICFRELRER